MAKVGKNVESIRVAVVDDDTTLCLCLKDIFHSGTNFTFAGNFSNAAEALRELPNLKPDLTLMDIRLPDLDGIQCAKQLRRAMPFLKIIILTGMRERSWVDASLQAGVAAYLIKPFVTDQLLATLSFAADKQEETQSGRSRRNGLLFRTKAIAGNLPLNPRESIVLKHLADGLLYKEISDRLGISYSAVHKCLDHIYKKLGVSNRSEAIRVWIDAGHP